MTVIEKKRDIGVLKALGATDKMITNIFLFEGISVGIIGMVWNNSWSSGSHFSSEIFSVV